jgi:hypothetical protein
MFLEPRNEWIKRLAFQDSFAEFEEDARRR